MAEPLTLGQLGRVLARHWILLLIGTVVGAAAGFGVTQLMAPVYTAQATQLVKAVPGTGSAANYEAAQYAVSRAKAYPPFIYSLPVLEGVRSDTNGRESLADLRRDLSATNPIDTPLIEITAEGATAEEARDLANSAARHMARFITQIETVAGKSPVSVETAVQAALPQEASSPRVTLITALGALIGFALATLIAVVHSYVRAGRPKIVKHETRGLGWQWDAEQEPATVAEKSAEGPVQTAPAEADPEAAPTKPSASAAEARAEH